LRLSRRLKVAVLIKDIVGGKERLFKSLLHPPPAKKRSRVKKWTANIIPIGLGEAHQYGWQVGKLPGQVMQSGPAALYKICVEEQVARRIAEQRQLGGNCQVYVGSAAKCPGDKTAVSRKITNRGIQLQ
jgi:hypothetical protein